MKKFLNLFKNLLIKLLEFRISNLKNFMIFTVCYAILNISVRLFLLKNFSNNFNISVIYWLLTVISFFSLFSIFVFYVRNNYHTQIEAFVNKFIDIKRIRENNKKRELMDDLVERQSNIDFRYAELFPFVMILLGISQALCCVPLMFLCSILCFWYFLYFVRMRRAYKEVQVPPELYLKPSNIRLRFYDNLYFFKDWLYDIWGIKKPYQSNAVQVIENSGRRKLTPFVLFGLFGSTLGAVSGAWFLSQSYYSSRGLVSPLVRWASVRDRGYESEDEETLRMARGLEAWGCDMRSYCYSNTSTLDKAAVRRANNYLDYNRDNGKVIGEDVPLPVGPHITNLELKESSFNEDLKRSPASVEAKEIDFPSDI